MWRAVFTEWPMIAGTPASIPGEFQNRGNLQLLTKLLRSIEVAQNHLASAPWPKTIEQDHNSRISQKEERELSEEIAGDILWIYINTYTKTYTHAHADLYLHYNTWLFYVDTSLAMFCLYIFFVLALSTSMRTKALVLLHQLFLTERLHALLDPSIAKTCTFSFDEYSEF